MLFNFSNVSSDLGCIFDHHCKHIGKHLHASGAHLLTLGWLLRACAGHRLAAAGSQMRRHHDLREREPVCAVEPGRATEAMCGVDAVRGAKTVRAAKLHLLCGLS
jgi:hypothetical protein